FLLERRKRIFHVCPPCSPAAARAEKHGEQNRETASPSKQPHSGNPPGAKSNPAGERGSTLATLFLVRSPPHSQRGRQSEECERLTGGPLAVAVAEERCDAAGAVPSRRVSRASI